MNNFLILITALFIVYSSPAPGQSNTPADGQFRKAADQQAEVWNAETRAWVSPEAFWEQYAVRAGGTHWGSKTDYPPYNEVEELDTIIIVLESGACLMEFWHSRWRRANDVRRWDPAFDEYAGCPHVFD